MNLRQLHRLDAALGDLVRSVVGQAPGAVAITRHTTDLGSMFMVTAAAVGLRRFGHRRSAAEVLTAGSLAWVIAHYAKTLVDRPRPYEAEQVRRLIPPPTGSSMPSGHAAVVSAVTTVLASHSRPGERWGWPLVTAWVPTTRIFLGVHYPADTVAGAVLGHGLGRAVAGVSARLPVGPPDEAPA